MIAVIFEVEPHPGRNDDYLREAARLKPILESMDGFSSVELFESLTTPGRILSLSICRDEEAVSAWRNAEAHRQPQPQGRTRIFRDYRQRVAAVLRDYGMNERADATADSRAAHGM